jgi:hypothetical protein
MEGTASQGLSKTHDRKSNHQRAIRRMKLSIEAKVAAAVAVAFATISIGAIAQEQSERGTTGLSQVSLRGPESSLSTQNESGENQLLAQY